MSQVVTRFAPSPTGYLHIGGARTALFSWAYAQNKGGKMLLRIEDTDRARSTEGAILAILDGLRWLELDWDGEPVYQLTRAERHREIAEQLLAQGNAYRCYASPAELEAMRERARAEGRAPGYDGTWRHRERATRRQAEALRLGQWSALPCQLPARRGSLCGGDGRPRRCRAGIRSISRPPRGSGREISITDRRSASRACRKSVTVIPRLVARPAIPLTFRRGLRESETNPADRSDRFPLSTARIQTQ